MKSQIKKILNKFGLLEFARMFYNSMKYFSLNTVLGEIRYSNKPLPDGFPAPTARLIFLIIGLRWKTVYYSSGKVIFDEMKLVLDKNGISINNFKKVLDFGCGVGRILRHFNNYDPQIKIYGTDYNPELIRWCKDNLTLADFRINNLLPPMDYEDESFDFLYARSVFTHLGLEAQKKWIREFQRILRKGGIIYLTTHFSDAIKNLSDAEREELFTNGIVSVNLNLEGENRCTTYEIKDYFVKNIISDLKLIDYIPNKNTGKSNQDIYLLKKI